LYLADSIQLTDEKQMEGYVTPAMYLKLFRRMAATDADPLIQVQDVAGEVESVKCTPIKNRWFQLTYVVGHQPEHQIKLLVDSVCREARIMYVLPFGEDIPEKDLFDIPSTEVCQESEKSFIYSFYRAYINCYARMEEDVEEQLTVMREKYCTDSLMNRFAEEREAGSNYADGYDMLIANFDYDATEGDQLQVEQIAPQRYDVKLGNEVNLIVDILIEENGYRLSNIHLKN